MMHWFTSDHVLALIAIIFGLVGIYYERRLHRRFKAQELEIQKSFDLQKDKIEQIVLSVHTSFIGKFPLDLEKITELVRNAKDGDDLWVLVDFLGYGIYSDPERFEEYVRALIEAKANVRILIHDDAAAKNTLEMQFKRVRFGELRKTANFRHFLDHYRKVISSDEPAQYEDFLNTLVEVQDHFCQQLTAKAHIDVRSTPRYRYRRSRILLDGEQERDDLLLSKLVYRAKGVLIQDSG